METNGHGQYIVSIMTFDRFYSATSEIDIRRFTTATADSVINFLSKGSGSVR
jgi:hypothetical protein